MNRDTTPDGETELGALEYFFSRWDDESDPAAAAVGVDALPAPDTAGVNVAALAAVEQDAPPSPPETDDETSGAASPSTRTNDGELAGKAARGAAVVVVGQVSRIILQTATVVILARLLSPRDYGLVAMVTIVVGVGEVFRDFGLSTAAIRAPSLSAGQRSALFWINTVIGASLAIVLVACAPLVAAAFGQPVLTPVCRALALTFVLNGLASQYRADLARKLRFGKVTLSDFVGQVIGLGVAFVAAVLGAGYWALVAQQLSQLAVALMLLVYFARWVPAHPLARADVRSFLRLGGHLAATQAIYYVTNNVDTGTVAIRFSSAALGIYNRGFSLLMSPLTMLRSQSTTVALPVLSRLRDDPDRAGHYLARAQLTFGYTLVAGLGITSGASASVVALLLGPKWTAVGPVLMFLAVAGACSTLSYVGLWVYLSRGLGRDLMRYTAVTLVLQATCIIVGSEWHVGGVAAGYMIAAIIEWPLSLVWLSRRTVIPLNTLLLGAARVTVCAAAAGVAAFLASHAAGHVSAALGVLAGVLAGVAAYAVAALVAPPVRSDLLAVREVLYRIVKR